MADKRKVPATIEIEMLTGASGTGWAAPKGLYSCPEARAKMLIKRGYAKPCSRTE